MSERAFGTTVRENSLAVGMDTTILELGKDVLHIEMEGLAAVRERLDERFMQALEILAACRGRLVVTGIGKSGLVGRKLAATFSSTGTAAFFMHPTEAAHGDMGSVRPDDVVLAISNSGETAELSAILPMLRALHVRVVALTGKTRSTLGLAADVVIDTAVPREACPLGLAPTASTTAVLGLGDALAVCLMRLKGFSEKDFLAVHPGGSLGQRLRLSVKQVMRTRDIPAAAEHTPQAEALQRLDKGRLGALLVLGENRGVLGILTDGDVRRALCAGDYAPEAPVCSIMTRSPRCAALDDNVAALLDIMERKSITVLPIVDDHGVLLGIVHMHDLLGQGTVSFSE